MLNGRHHVVQLKKNWVIVTFILTVVFGAGGVWALFGEDFVEQEQFQQHIASENKLMDDKFTAQKELIDEKFKNTDQKIEHLDEHLEEIKELIREQ